MAKPSLPRALRDGKKRVTGLKGFELPTHRLPFRETLGHIERSITATSAHNTPTPWSGEMDSWRMNGAARTTTRG